jgi:hypothetical protein
MTAADCSEVQGIGSIAAFGGALESGIGRRARIGPDGRRQRRHAELRRFGTFTRRPVS